MTCTTASPRSTICMQHDVAGEIVTGLVYVEDESRRHARPSQDRRQAAEPARRRRPGSGLRRAGEDQRRVALSSFTDGSGPSLRANGSRERAPDDRLREAIHPPAPGMDCFVCIIRSRIYPTSRHAPRNDDPCVRDGEPPLVRRQRPRKLGACSARPSTSPA